MMNPDANLQEQREISNRILNSEEFSKPDVERLAELVQLLDGHIAGGEPLPADWQVSRETPNDLVSANGIRGFNLVLRDCTNEQLPSVYLQEVKAGRYAYAELVRSEGERRGLDIK